MEGGCTFRPAQGVAPFDQPASAPQPQGKPIDTFDTRLLGATERYGAIYTANTTKDVAVGNPALQNGAGVTANPYANVQWYAITPTAGGYVSPAPTYAIAGAKVAYLMGAVLPGCPGTVATDASGATSCSAAPFVAAEVSGSGRSQPASAFRVRNAGPPAVYAQGVGGYAPCASCATSRWGDYPGLATDPGNPAKVWVVGEYAKAKATWGTAVSTVTPSSP
jgi:hypothetical protein